MIRRLFILFFIVYVGATENGNDGITLIDIDWREDNDGIIYLNDVSYQICAHTTSWSEGFTLENGFPKPFFLAKCDEETFEIKLVDKMVFSDGSITTGKELTEKYKKMKFKYFSLTAGFIVLLVIITT